MVIQFIQKLLGDPSQKFVKNAWKTVEKINKIEQELQNFSDQQVLEKFQNIKEKISSGIETKKFLPEVFAIVKNVCRKISGKKFKIGKEEITWNMIPFDVQILGGICLHAGKISEMKTGEGKTLVASFPAILESLTGKGVHVITVNDYLAKRDADWNKPIYDFLGLSVGAILHGLNNQERCDAYNCDITYGTNNEFGFDYLRDNMATSSQNLVQKNLHFAIIDEVDSILIDEARTPLIISAPAEESTSKYQKYANLVKRLEKNTDFLIDEKRKTAILTEKGIEKMERLMGVSNIYTDAGFAEVHHIEQALKAEFVFKKDSDYVVKNQEVIIVDEFTGRMMPGRRYSDGLHQAIEAKENVEIKRESKTLATITFQNYFRLYKKLAGMTGTAKTEEEEFLKIYGLEVCQIPTNKPIARKDLNDLIFKNEYGKFLAIIKKTKEKHISGQPVLIGTISIEKSEALSQLLHREKIPHEVLNAKNHAREAEIIARAGEFGAVTIATNMAGRGTDIKLGKGISETGGLCIIGSERHESRRIDNQLRGRSGRQGDPGETQFFISLEDSLMRLFGSERLQKIMEVLKIPDDMPIENKFVSRSIESAQKKVEGYHFDMRKHVVQYDDVMNRQREIIYTRRKKILQNEDLHSEVLKWIENEVEVLANFHLLGREANKMEIDKFAAGISTIFFENALNDDQLKNLELPEKMIELAKKFLLENFEKKANSFPDTNFFRQVERSIILRIIDQFWMNHIDEMSHLREIVSLRGYAQKNPLHEYQTEGFAKFKNLLAKVQSESVNTLFKINVEIKFDTGLKDNSPKNLQTNEEEISDNLTETEMFEKSGPKRISANSSNKNNNTKAEKKVGRNEDCPCGSGKKFKKCCGK